MPESAYAVVMPVYNEEPTVGGVLEEWINKLSVIKPVFIVINDGSKDNTLGVLKGLSSKYNNVLVFDKPNSGHGQSCIYGYRKAVEMGFAYIFQTDSDGQTDPEDYLKYFKLAEHSGFVLGYRPKRGDGFARLVISRTLSFILFLLTGVFIKDSNVPFRFFRRDLLQKVIDKIPEDFYLANILVALKAAKLCPDYRVVEISFKTRAGGEASVSGLKFLKLAAGLIKDILKIRPV